MARGPAQNSALMLTRLVRRRTATRSSWTIEVRQESGFLRTWLTSTCLRARRIRIHPALQSGPEVLAMLQDLDSAGRILKVDGSYPGAAAQAANAMKRGFMSHAVSKVASGTGALIGSSMGPVGAMAGAQPQSPIPGVGPGMASLGDLLGSLRRPAMTVQPMRGVDRGAV